MSKITYKHAFPARNSVDSRKSARAYTHVIVSGEGTAAGVIQWCQSEANARAKVSYWANRGFDAVRVEAINNGVAA